MAFNHQCVTCVSKGRRVVETRKLLHTPDCRQEAFTLLSKIAANLPGMIFQIRQQQDGSQFVLYVSSGCRELYELEPEVIQADLHVLCTLIHPQDVQGFDESMAVAAASLAPWRWQGRIITPSGKLKWIQGASQLERLANGDLLWDGLVMDITDRKQAEAKLCESEARYKAILDAIPDLMFRISRDGEYLDLKDDGANVVLAKEEIVGKNLQDLLPNDVVAISQEAIAKTVNSGTLQTCEYQLPMPLGVRDYEARLVASGQNEVLAIVRDITERKQAEAQLRLSAQRDRLLKETLVRIRSSLDLEQILQTTVTEVRQFLQVNRVFIGLNDLPEGARIVAESVEPKYPSILGWSTDDQAYIQELRTLLATNRILVVEDTAKISGSPKLRTHYQQFQTRASLVVPIILGNELLGALIANQCTGTRQWQAIEIDLLQQMSEQLAIAIRQSLIYQELAALNTNLERQVEERTGQLQQKMQELEELHRIKDVVLHTVAHDLRTSVMGNLMVLKHLQKNREVCTSKESVPSIIPVSSSIIKRMIQGNDHQLGMLDSLLEIHCSEKQGVVLHRELINLSQLLEAMLTDLQPILTQNQATLTNLVSADLPLVMADSTQLQRVLANLLTHSLQHNPPGLNFTLKAKVAGGMIHTQIQNNGVAINKLECDRFFDLYVRAPQATCSTGISLKMYLCRQIIQAHGGEIGIISHPTHGLTFWFTLPLTPVKLEAPTSDVLGKLG